MILSGETAAKLIGCVAGRYALSGQSSTESGGYHDENRPHLVDGFEPIHKNGGIYKKNTTACEIRQEGFGKFMAIKWRE